MYTYWTNDRGVVEDLNILSQAKTAGEDSIESYRDILFHRLHDLHLSPEINILYSSCMFETITHDNRCELLVRLAELDALTAHLNLSSTAA